MPPQAVYRPRLPQVNRLQPKPRTVRSVAASRRSVHSYPQGPRVLTGLVLSARRERWSQEKPRALFRQSATH